MKQHDDVRLELIETRRGMQRFLVNRVVFPLVHCCGDVVLQKKSAHDDGELLGRAVAEKSHPQRWLAAARRVDAAPLLPELEVIERGKVDPQQCWPPVIGMLAALR